MSAEFRDGVELPGDLPDDDGVRGTEVGTSGREAWSHEVRDGAVANHGGGREGMWVGREGGEVGVVMMRNQPCGQVRK